MPDANHRRLKPDAGPGRTLVRVAVVAGAVLLLGGLFIALRPQAAAACDEPTAHITVQLRETRLDPFQIEVCRGQQVELTIVSSVDGAIHIHGEIDEAAQVFEGQTLTMSFEAFGADQQPIELHTATADLMAGALILHDP